MATQQPIHIIGAGIAGLTLGRCLKSKGIPAIIFESQKLRRGHNYGISLHLPPLLKLLNMDEDSLRSLVAVDSELGGKGRVSAGSLSLPSIANGDLYLRAHRGRFESLLREGLDIKWQHGCERIDRGEASSTGHTVIFKNEEKFKSNFTVDTCGVHSHMHKQLSPESQNHVLPYVVFRGVRRIEGNAIWEKYGDLMTGSTILEMKRGDICLQISANDCHKELGVVDISYIYSRPSRPNDPLHRPERGVNEAAEVPWEHLYAEVTEFFTQYESDAPFKNTFKVQKMKKDRMLHWLMRSSLVQLAELKTLAGGGIMMLGDAVHAMPILGGEGANLAIEDGIALADHVALHGTSSLQDFYTGRYEVWQRSVGESEKRLADMHSKERAIL